MSPTSDWIVLQDKNFILKKYESKTIIVKFDSSKMEIKNHIEKILFITNALNSEIKITANRIVSPSKIDGLESELDFGRLSRDFADKKYITIFNKYFKNKITRNK